MKVTEWKCEIVSCTNRFMKSMGAALVMMMLIPGASKVFSQEAEAEIKVDGEKAAADAKVTPAGNSDSEAIAAEAKVVENKSTEEKKPDVKTPDVKTPDVKTPDVKTPEEKSPEQPQEDGTKAAAEAAAAEATVTANKPVITHSVAMAALHNQYRAQSGLAAQAVDENLTNVAQNWANHMAAVGSMYHGGGEQIIAYSGGDRSYDAGFRTWLGSSPHRAWLCSRGDRCGFGYAIGRNGCAYYAGAFGSSYTAPAVSTSTNQSYQTNSYSYSNNYSGRRGFFRRRG